MRGASNPRQPKNAKIGDWRTARRSSGMSVLRTATLRIVLAAIFACIGSGCASLPKTAGPEDNDPLERMNRAVFSFNLKTDRAVLRPVATGYRRVTPDPVERRISNFLANLSGPVVVASDLLQGKFRRAGADTGRFLINSTVGLLGMFDVAGHMGLEARDVEDLGQVLGKWGIGRGPYIMVPVIGPYSLRDGVGRLLALPLEPLREYDNDNGARNSLAVLYGIDARAALLAADDELDAAFDPYIFLRDAYYQRREYLLHDGEPPSFDEDFGIEFSEEDFLGAPQEPAP